MIVFMIEAGMIVLLPMSAAAVALSLFMVQVLLMSEAMTVLEAYTVCAIVFTRITLQIYYFIMLINYYDARLTSY